MDSQYPIFAKEQKDIPDWLKSYHEWQAAIDINKLPKFQLKVKMCCPKCEEKVIEEIREVPGVFDVRAERMTRKVVVVAMPTPTGHGHHSHYSGLDQHEVLRRAKKIHRKAKFVELDAKEKPKKEDDKKKKDDDDKKKNNKEQASTTNTVQYVSQPLQYWGQHYAYQPSSWGEYRPSQSYLPRYQYPPLPNQPEGPYRQYVYYY